MTNYFNLIKKIIVLKIYWLHDKNQSIIVFKFFNYLKMMISKWHLEFRSTQTQPSESESHSVITDSLQPRGLYSPWNSLGQNRGVGSLSLLQGSFSTQGSNPNLLHCRQILYQLCYQGSPKVNMGAYIRIKTRTLF